jgi:hypothetical protein
MKITNEIWMKVFDDVLDENKLDETYWMIFLMNRG